MSLKMILIFKKHQPMVFKLTFLFFLIEYCFVSWNSYESVTYIDERVFQVIRDIRDKMVVEDDVFVKEYNISCTEKSLDGTEDLLCMTPPTFLKEYKNPCWYSNTKHLRCLPYFHLIGSGKCASSDYFDRIIKHPDAFGNAGFRQKETQWWSWRRYGIQVRKLKRRRRETIVEYLNYFRVFIAWLQGYPGRDFIAGVYGISEQNFIGDGSVMDLSDNCGWPSVPQNNGLKEPKFTTAHLIRHMNPDVKLLVILRDPVERLYSDYYFRGVGNMTREGFHEDVVAAIKIFHNCTRKASFRTCLYNRYMHYILPVRLHMGFYFIFLQEWFQVFPRDQFLIIRTEDYSSDMIYYLQKTFRFLGLRELSIARMRLIAAQQRSYVTSNKINAENMKPETRKILQELYGKFNEELARLLNDGRYTWQYKYTK